MSNKQIFTALVTFVDQLVKVFDNEQRYKSLYTFNSLLEKMTLGDEEAIGRHVSALKTYLEFNKSLLIDRRLENAIHPEDKLVYRTDTNGQPKIYLNIVQLLEEAPSEEIKDTIYNHLAHLAILCFPEWRTDIVSSVAASAPVQKVVPEGGAKSVEEVKGKVKELMDSVKTSLGNVDKSKGFAGMLELFTGDTGQGIIKQFEGITNSNLDGRQMASAALAALQEEMQSGNLNLSAMFSSLTGGKKPAATGDARMSEQEIIEMADRLKRVDAVYGVGEQLAIADAPKKEKKKKVVVDSDEEVEPIKPKKKVVDSSTKPKTKKKVVVDSDEELEPIKTKKVIKKKTKVVIDNDDLEDL